LALRTPIHGALFNDAGVGKEGAGIAGIYLLERWGVYAAAVDAFSARIGSCEDTQAGRISFANSLSGTIGIESGMPAKEAARLMALAPSVASGGAHKIAEALPTAVVVHESIGGRRIIAMDSNSMIGPDNLRDIVFTGSHGGLVGSKPAVPYPVAAVFYNDAGIGKNNAGISRLPWLQRAGIAAATVSAASAKIGSGLETCHCGIISHMNGCAAKLGIKAGTRAMVAAMLIRQALAEA
jgi:hypothetical protein